MKEPKLILIASDLHGRVKATKTLVSKIEALKPDWVWLLGDYLYNGPRNGVPDDYEPMEVSKMLSALNVPVLGVRGNCDSRVDAMLLPFPFEDFAEALVYDKSFLLYHGDLPIKEGYEPDVIVSGHTHIPVLEEDEKGRILLNPGSPSFPKGGYPASYALLDDKGLKVLSLETDEPIFAKSF